MSRLPSLKSIEVVRALKKAGFVENRQTGSHLVLDKPNRPLIVTVPMHGRELKRGTLRAIIEQTTMTREEFLVYL